ncbi:hypothetical protein NKJ23_15930 [Mesorhizobium sp. M0184]|uniref:hypothetical protein n=1 Tax=unclassified Mesorhizobium TaxID=325217 RepID=UPI00333A7CA4
MKSLVTLARHAYLHGFTITADVYMRQALCCANRLQDSKLRAAVFVIRNKMRPHVRAALNPVSAA